MSKKADKQKGKSFTISIYGQIILTIITIIMAIWWLDNHKVLGYLQLLLGLDLLIMAYNNKNVYQRNNFTIVYIIIGIIVLVMAGLNLWRLYG